LLGKTMPNFRAKQCSVNEATPKIKFLQLHLIVIHSRANEYCLHDLPTSHLIIQVSHPFHPPTCASDTALPMDNHFSSLPLQPSEEIVAQNAVRKYSEDIHKAEESGPDAVPPIQ